MASWRWLLSAALAASAISSVATVQAEEENENEGPVSTDEIPAPALDAILRHVGGGRLMGIQEETGQRGEPEYVGRISQGGRAGRQLIIRVDEAGNVLGIIGG
jgi:hypothetical protein